MPNPVAASRFDGKPEAENNARTTESTHAADSPQMDGNAAVDIGSLKPFIAEFVRNKESDFRRLEKNRKQAAPRQPKRSSFEFEKRFVVSLCH